jgi:hypothetical protein
MKRALIAGMMVLSVWGPALAKPDELKQVRQMNANVSLVVTNPEELSGRLTGLVQRHNGVVQSFSLDASSTSASASLQCPPSELNELMTEIPKLGRIENQNMSSSDYTSSYRDAANKVRVYEALSLVPLDRSLSASNLSPEDQAMARSEIQQLIRERISSYQSSMQSYRDYNDRAQISIQFRIVSPEQLAARPVTPTTTETPGTAAPATPAPAPVNQGTLLPLYLLGFVNLTFLWLMARRSPATPAAPAPPPTGTHD